MGCENTDLMKILVTGATGYLGQHICEFLQEKGYEVVGFIRDQKKGKLLQESKIPYLIGDITDRKSIVQVMQEGFDLVINSAGYISDRGPWKPYKEVNVNGVENVADAMKITNIKRIIQISSIAAYGTMVMDGNEEIEKRKPRWFKYGVTKQEGEEKLLEYKDLDITILRPGHIVGKRDRLGYLPILYYSMRKNRRFINKGLAIIPLVYLGHVLEAIKLCIENPDKTVGEAFNIVSPEKKTINDVAKIVHEELGYSVPNKSLGFRTAFVLGTIFEAMSIFGFKAPLSRMGVVLAGKDAHFTSKKLESIGWKHTKSVEDMVKEWASWRLEYEKQRKKSN